MDDILSILLVVIFYLVATFSGSKKRKAKQTARKSARMQDVQFPPSAYDMEGEASREGASAKRYEADCEQRRIHLHEVTQQQMADAFEGEDPCHAGHAPEMQEEAVFSYDEEQAQADGFAQDVLRGVIMSEILTRPCQRAAMKRNGRSIR